MLAQFVPMGAVCPEAEVGLPVTKDTLRRRFRNDEEEGRLVDRRLRENFVERVCLSPPEVAVRGAGASPTWWLSSRQAAALAHSPAAYSRLGRIVAGAKGQPREALRRSYEGEFMAALAVLATPGRHAKVLGHMLGYVSPALDREQRTEITALIEDYRRELLPLLVPLMLLRHHVSRLGVRYLLGQVYLDPHPKELMLRNNA
jgi:uncharacterized protein YbgA (DUF1722 family)